MIKIIGIGKIKDKNLASLIDHYQKQINNYHKLQIIEVKDEPIINNDHPNAIMQREGERVLKQIKDDEYVVLLDLHGEQLDSLQLAKWLDKSFVHHDKLCFVIGGSLGLGENLLKRANYRLKLSNLTFLHGMTRLILLEQIYRAFKINNNETYHK